MQSRQALEDLTDEVLMRMYLSGQQAAFDVVYRRRREGLRRFFERQCGSAAVAKELAQESWFKLIRACQNGQYTAEAKFTTYLYRLGKNLRFTDLPSDDNKTKTPRTRIVRGALA